MENEQPIAPQDSVVETLTPPAGEAPAPVTVKKSATNYILAATAVLLVTVGAVITYVSLNANPKVEPVQLPAQAESLPELTLSLTNPSVDSVAEMETVLVSGVTSPNTPVILMTETNDSDTQSDDQGNFSANIKLDSGVNELTVTAFRSDGQEKSLTFEIVYDDQVLGQQTGADSQAAKKTKPTKQIVKDSFESVSRAHSVDKTTIFTDEKNKPIKPGSIKPNDRVMAIVEEMDGNATPAGQIKKAIKIIARSATESASLNLSVRRAIQGVVTDVTASTLQLSHQIQRDRIYQVLYSDQTSVVASIGTASGSLVPALLQVGQRVIVVGNTIATGEIQATRIRIIPGKATGVFTKQPVTPYPTMTVIPTVTSTPSATPSVTITPTLTPTSTPIPTQIPTPTPTTNPGV